MSKPGYQIESVVSPPFEEVAYVLWQPGHRAALVVDPSFETDPILALIQTNNLNVVAILNTHGHVDHIAGNARLKECFPDADLIIGRNETQLLNDPWANLSAQFGQAVTSPPADRLVEDGQRLELAGLTFEVREIPGHSPGSVVFLCQDAEPPFVLGGDVLFAGSIGRFDFPGCDGTKLVQGIRSQLLNLPDETVVYPGHGPSTTIGIERRSNPFLGQSARLEDA